jgi:exonuclease III
MAKVKNNQPKTQPGKKKSNRSTRNKKYLSIITLNANKFNSSIKRHRLSEWIKMQDPIICCLQEIYLTTKDTHKLKVGVWKTIYQACGDQKQAGATTLISDKAYFKQKLSQKR